MAEVTGFEPARAFTQHALTNFSSSECSLEKWKCPCGASVRLLYKAEVTGFEPARAFTQHAFQACALNPSATLPCHNPERRERDLNPR